MRSRRVQKRAVLPGSRAVPATSVTNASICSSVYSGLIWRKIAAPASRRLAWVISQRGLSGNPNDNTV